MMDKRTIIELVNTEVKTAGIEYAEQLFPELSKQIAEQTDERLNDWLGENLHGHELDDLGDTGVEKLARELIQPAFLQAVNARLATMLLQASNGWDSILWSNMAERYDATGEV